ncbi:hypothetical protein CCP4SC76_810009 [Gammaproteobacteria bacterium]
MVAWPRLGATARKQGRAVLRDNDRAGRTWGGRGGGNAPPRDQMECEAHKTSGARGATDLSDRHVAAVPMSLLVCDTP